jgi:hypothetical protein
MIILCVKGWAWFLIYLIDGVMAVFIWKVGKSDISLGIVEKSTIIIEE